MRTPLAVASVLMWKCRNVKLFSALNLALTLPLLVTPGRGQTTIDPNLAYQVRQLNDKDPAARRYAAGVIGSMGPKAEAAVPALIAALKDPDENVRGRAAFALGRLAPPGRGAGAVAALADALRDSDMQVRKNAASALAGFGSEAKAAIPALIADLNDNSDASLRVDAAWAIRRIGPDAQTLALLLTKLQSNPASQLAAQDALLTMSEAEAKAAIPRLKAGLQNPDVNVRRNAASFLLYFNKLAQPAVPEVIAALKDSDPTVRVFAIDALGAIGLKAEGAEPALLAALNDPQPAVRRVAVLALGSVAPESRSVASAVTRELRENDPTIKLAAAVCLAKMAASLRDANPPRTDKIEELTQVARTLDAASFPEQAQQVRTALSVLKAIHRGEWGNRLLAKIRNYPGMGLLSALYLSLVTLWLVLLWKLPLSLWEINERLALLPKLRLPGWLGGVEVSLPNLLVVGFFHYHSRVLDAWVAKHSTAAREQFGQIKTVQGREVYVEAPAELDGKVNPELKPADLQPLFRRKPACLLVWGEGGAGKTSVACQIARWAMVDDITMRPAGQRMLPLLIEQDLNLEVGKDKTVLMEVLRGQLKNLIRANEAPPAGLVRQLLRQQRVLLIVDGLSELNEVTRNKIRPLDPEFDANALVVTSRLEEDLDGVTKTTLHPLRIRGNRMASFMEAYLQKRHKRTLFDDTEFFEGCKRLSMMVGERDITVLLAKLYAEQMVAAKEKVKQRLPENVPDLMLEYINEVNRRERRLDDRTVQAVATKIAWECVRQTYRPMPARIDAVLAALGGDTAREQIDNLEHKLQMVETIGAGRDRIRFALDPLAEYLAALHAVHTYGDDEKAWREFLAQTHAAPGAPEGIRGFLLAVYDWCVVMGARAEVSVPGFVIKELRERIHLDREVLEQSIPLTE
jgi:HEAT repeat protein